MKTKLKEILGHRLVLKMCEVQNAEKVSTGGIILEAKNKIEEENSEIGVVVQIGLQAWKDVGDGTPWAKVGDLVSIQKYAGKQRKSGLDTFRIINDEDLLSIEEIIEEGN
jgi:co-chaperonin GroES (HSP10)